MRIAGQRIYLDANIFIYAMEEIAPWAQSTCRLLEAIDAGRCTAVTSELTIAECLVKPFELGRSDVVETYLDLLRSRGALTIAPISREILVAAAEARAAHGLKLPDAVHVATALNTQCAFMITNDRALANVPFVQTAPLSDLAFD